MLYFQGDCLGITRNPTEGQSLDIYQQIVDLIKRYIEPNTAIVLHVIPSSVDFTTSESIQLAKRYDPDCKKYQNTLYFIIKVLFDIHR